ncbi:MAG: FdtA/QdtA family cupin domain-containing protein [Cyanobacteriota bacterium]
MKPQLLKFKVMSDGRGSLIALEETKNIPFTIKRIYYLYKLNSELIRGKHAHKTLQQVLICTSGRCKILLDNGKEKCTVELDSPDKGLIINNLVWREMFDFSPDCVIMVVADQHYDEEDYIRDYKDFIKEVNNNANI